MATNKHAIIRYKALDKCFRNHGRKYFIDDLIDACNDAIYEFTGTDIGIKRRQIFEDIKFMESPQGWDIPLEHCRDGHKIFYQYSDRSFSINNQPLNETEENQLKEALMTLSNFKGMPQFEWVEEITARLNSVLGISRTTEKIIEFDQNNYLKGLEHITPLYNSILYKKAIHIEYKSFKQDTPHLMPFHPYFLKQYNNRWYVFGKNDDSQFVLNLALDRIISIADSSILYQPNNTIDFNEYFEDIVGVSLSTEATLLHIILNVRNELLPYIKTKPLHGSQKLKDRGTTHTTITLDLIPNYELESVILSHGEGIEVLAPDSLRDKMRMRIELINNNYNKSADTLQTKP
ncbi:MAG: WYL domain-containing protein [Ignavibacteria bacterium]|nr:WYL domain-containing protein [Ignavibacteria bacterium]